jgi:hypothetical protein
LGQNALNRAATHVPEVGIVDDTSGQVAQRPVGDGRADLSGLGGGQNQNLVAIFRGKKRPGGRCGGGRLSHPGADAGNAAASGTLYRDHSRMALFNAPWSHKLFSCLGSR